MRSIDCNVDAGEYASAAERDKESQILALLSRCNIACGGHAGNETSMRHTLRCARHYGLQCGAHPSYPDVQGFGRRVLSMSAGDLRNSLKQQIGALQTIARELDCALTHVKPHGALYNKAMEDDALSVLIAEVVAELDVNFALLGMPNSALEAAAARVGLAFLREGFVDRRYRANGALVARSEKGAVIEEPHACAAQALALAEARPVRSYEGAALTLQVQTLCLHGDNPHALEVARSLHAAFVEAGFSVGCGE